MNATPEQRVRLVAHFNAWYRAYGNINWRINPGRLPDALRDVSSVIRVAGLRHVTCPVLSALIGLLEPYEQRRVSRDLADDPHPNRPQNRFPVAETIVRELRHPLALHFRNPYNFLAAYQLAILRTQNFLVEYPITVDRIRRSETRRRRVARRDAQQQPQHRRQHHQPQRTSTHPYAYQAPTRNNSTPSDSNHRTPRTAHSRNSTPRANGPIRIRRVLAPTLPRRTTLAPRPLTPRTSALGTTSAPCTSAPCTSALRTPALRVSTPRSPPATPIIISSSNTESSSDSTPCSLVSEPIAPSPPRAAPLALTHHPTTSALVPAITPVPTDLSSQTPTPLPAPVSQPSSPIVSGIVELTEDSSQSPTQLRPVDPHLYLTHEELLDRYS